MVPCRPWEEDVQITGLLPNPALPVTPTKPPGNDGAYHDNSDAGRSVTESDEEVELLPNKKRKHVLATYEVVQRWVTGDRAKQPEEGIERRILEHARLLMHLSRLKELPCHKSLQTNIYLWKRAGRYTSRGVQYVSSMTKLSRFMTQP